MRAEEGCRSCCHEEFRPKNFLLGHDIPVLFVRAQWSWPVWIYPVYKLLMAAFFTAMIIISGVVPYNWYIGEANRVKWFIYLTNHMFFFVTISVIYQAVVSVYAAFKFKNRLRNEDVYGPMPWYLKLEWILYNLSSCVAVLTTILFWGLLYSPGNYVHWIDIITHAANTVYVVLDIFITATPMRLLHFWHPLLYGIIYILFSVFYHLAGGTNAIYKPYIYSVLSWFDPGTAALYSIITIFVGFPIVWLILYSLHALRVFIHWKLGGDFWTASKQETTSIQMA